MNKNKGMFGARDGVSLTEVVVAIGLFMIGMLGVFALGAQLRRVNAFSEDYSVATMLAEAKVEELRAGAFGDVTAGSDTNGDFVRIWSVASNATLRTKSVRLGVTWTDLDTKQHRVSLQTILMEP